MENTHADFWVLVGTVSPVLALAHLVPLRAYWRLWRVGNNPPEMPRGWRLTGWILLGPLAVAPLLAALLSELACALSLYDALQSLATKQDAETQPNVVRLMFAVLALPAQMVLGALGRWYARLVGSDPPPIPR